MKAYPYPLTDGVLEDFRHPDSRNSLYPVVRCEGDLLAANGYVAIRCYRGLWFTEEYPEAGAKYLERFDSLPWDRPIVGDWRALDEARGMIWKRGTVGMWLRGTLAPSPVWRVVDSVCRLSVLQLVARLPKAEVFTGLTDPGEPVFFRFSGGRGIIAAETRLAEWSFHLWPPWHDALTGQRVERERARRPSFSLPGWPPNPAEDDF